MQFVCWLWHGRDFWKKTVTYSPEHVAKLASMLRRHGGHNLICVSDREMDIPGVRVVQMPAQVASLPDYLPKLWAWSPEFHEIVGQRFASIDLDVVILGDLAPVLARHVPLLIWDQANLEPYNTSLFVLVPGFCQRVWKEYTPGRLAAARAMADYWTGDQSWVAHILGPLRATFGSETGVHIYRPFMHQGRPPEGAKAMFFCGPYDPAKEREQSKWVGEHWN